MYYNTLEGRRRQIYDAWENGVGHFPTSRRRKSAHLLLQRQKTGFATRVTALRASVSQGGARQFSARPVGKTNFRKPGIYFSGVIAAQVTRLPQQNDTEGDNECSKLRMQMKQRCFFLKVLMKSD